MKILTIVGTRPEIIRLSVIIKNLDCFFDHILVHTGQNYDFELNEIFFDDLEIRRPDYFLEVNTNSLGSVLGDTISKIEPILLKVKPDAVLILGDTNSSIACIMAKRLKIPIYHMEAGNRSFDANVPEEINRKIIDHLADFNIVYSEHARRNLLAEGYPAKRIYLSGSPLFEVINTYLNKISKSSILEELKLKSKDYFLFSFHREENVDNKDNLQKILDIIDALRNKYQKKIIISTHPRTKKRLGEIVIKPENSDVLFLKPFNFSSYMKLQINAYCTISDSGTISEECSILNFPAITIRNSMERPEAIDAGTIILAGLDQQVVLNSITAATAERFYEHKKNIPSEYTVSNCSERIIKLILGTASLSNKWNGIENEILKK